VDCAIALIAKYVNLGQLDAAELELDRVLQQPHKERVMLNTLRMLDCTLPHTALSVFVLKLSNSNSVGAMLVDEAKYALLLWQWLEDHQCPEAAHWNQRTPTSVKQALLHKAQVLSSQTATLCVDIGLQQFLLQRHYRVHSCTGLLSLLPSSLLGSERLQPQQQPRGNVCELGHEKDLPFGSDAQRTSPSLNRFVGALILQHIWPYISLPHLWWAAKAEGRPLRVLLTGGVRVELLVQWWRSLSHTLPTDRLTVGIEVIVTHPDEDVLQYLQQTLEACRQAVPLEAQSASQRSLNVRYLPLTELMSRDALIPKYGVDLIDYNIAADVFPKDLHLEMTRLRALLSAHGRLFVSFFAENNVAASAGQLLQNRNVSFLAPFSTDAARLFLQTAQKETEQMLFPTRFTNRKGTKRNVLSALDTQIYMRDADWLRSLLRIAPNVSTISSPAPEDFTNSPVDFSLMTSLIYKVQDAIDRAAIGTDTSEKTRWTVEEMRSIANSHGLETDVCLPLALCHPYGTFGQYYEVQKYRASGVSEAQFRYHVLPSTRYTLVLSRSDRSDAMSVSGIDVVELTELDFIHRSDVLDSVVLHDLSQQLSTSFRPLLITMKSAIDGQEDSILTVEFEGQQRLQDLLQVSHSIPLSLVPLLAEASRDRTLGSLIDTLDQYFGRQTHQDSGRLQRKRRLQFVHLVRNLLAMHVVSLSHVLPTQHSVSLYSLFPSLAGAIPQVRSLRSMKRELEIEELESGTTVITSSVVFPKASTDSSDMKITRISTQDGFAATETQPLFSETASITTSKHLAYDIQSQRLKELGFSADFLNRFKMKHNPAGAKASSGLSYTDSTSPVDTTQLGQVQTNLKLKPISNNSRQGTPPVDAERLEQISTPVTTLSPVRTQSEEAEMRRRKEERLLDLGLSEEFLRNPKVRRQETNRKASSSSRDLQVEDSVTSKSSTIGVASLDGSTAALKPLYNGLRIVPKTAAESSQIANSQSLSSIKLPQSAENSQFAASAVDTFSATHIEPISIPDVRERNMNDLASDPPRDENRQDWIQLPLHRRAECFQKTFLLPTEESCKEAMPLKRRTASVHSTSYMKLVFDQLLSEKLGNLQLFPSSHRVTQRLSQIRNNLVASNRLQEGQLDVIRLDASNPDLLLPFNRALYVFDDPMIKSLPKHFFYEGALDQLQAMAKALQLADDATTQSKASMQQQQQKNSKPADFLVLDDAVTENTLLQLYRRVCLSTLWFDATNGAAVAAHADDGLGTSLLLRQFTQSLSKHLSVAPKTLRVKRFFAMSMLAVTTNASSPIFLGGAGEVVALLWLEGHESSFLHVHPKESAYCLFLAGLASYPAVHPEFLSRRGVLYTPQHNASNTSSRIRTDGEAINTKIQHNAHLKTGENCVSNHFEKIPSRSGRLILVRDQLPLQMHVATTVHQAQKDGNDWNWERIKHADTTTLLVIVLSAH
jgi:hypothetical protein